MEIVSGLFPHMVLQRNADDRSEALITGHSSETGALVATVTNAKGRALPGLKALAVGTARRGKWSATLTGIPVGGPYTVTLVVRGAAGDSARVTVPDVCVGDVWLMAGQSNMQGVGWLDFTLPPQPLVRAFYMDDHWDVAADPMHNLWDAVDAVHVDLCGGKPHPKPKHWGVCPGLAFGQELLARTGVPQGLIACAHGGTSMQQWDPKLKHLGSKSLYGALCRRLHQNGGRVAGMIWYQGESDAFTEPVKHYTARMVELVKALRRDTGHRTLPVSVVQIGRVVGLTGFFEHWNTIQELQRLLPQHIKQLTVVPAVDLPLDDCIHIAGDGQNRLGRRQAESLLALVGFPGAVPPIELESVSMEPNAQNGFYDAVATFRHVVGELVATGEPRGFSVVNAAGTNCSNRITLRGHQAVMRTGLSELDLQQWRVGYGLGADPYCNITDGADRGLPAFTPQALPRTVLYTPFCQRLRVSELRPLDRPVAALSYAEVQGLATTVQSFPSNFCDMHSAIHARAPQDALLVFAARCECATAMSLNLCLGYDGPVRLWLDGREEFTDLAGTNPAVMDAVKRPWKVAAGTHEIVVALGTNQGRAWGIFLRLQRLGVTAKQLNAVPCQVATPQWLE